MLNQKFVKTTLVPAIVILSLFYIAWSPFFLYKNFFFFDEERYYYFLTLPSETFSFLSSLFIFKFLHGEETRNEVAKFIILGLHLFNCFLYFFLFEKKKEKILGSAFLIFCPLVFYDISILDIRQSFIHSLAIFYFYISFNRDHFKYSDIITIGITFIGLYVDYSFLVVVMSDVFLNRFKKIALQRFVFSLAMFALFSWYEAFFWGQFKYKDAFLFEKNFSLSYLGQFSSSLVDFITGFGGFGLRVFENDDYPAGQMYAFGVIFVIAVIVVNTIIKKYYSSFLYVTGYILSILLICYFSGGNLGLIMRGQYWSDIVFKSSVWFCLFLMYSLLLSEIIETKKQFIVVLGFATLAFAWVNLLPNISDNTVRIKRKDAPVFWSLAANQSLRFQTNFSEEYPVIYKNLTSKSKIPVNGLEYPADPAVVQKLPILLKYDFYFDQRLYSQSLINLNLALLNGVISKELYQEYLIYIKGRWSDELKRTIKPLMFEVLSVNKPAANSLYLLSLLHFTEMQDLAMKKDLINEFDHVFK
jgi:hypothetical protein